MVALTPQQISDCSQILSQLQPGLLPLEIFNQIARLMRLPTVILIPVKKEDSKLFIGSVKREANDLWWPNLWHLAGTVFRSTDTMQDALTRLLHHELGIEKSDAPIFRNFLVHTSKRGAEILFIHSVENCQLKADSEMQWFSIDDLPADFLETEKNAVRELQNFYN